MSITGWTYGDTANSPSVSGNTENGGVTYTYATKGSTSYSATVPTLAGDYTVKAVIAATDNYNGKTVTTDFTIAQKALTITAKAQTITYGGSIATGTTQVTVGTLGTGDSLTAVTLTPSTSNATTNGTITPSAATIKNGNTDKTANYDITYATGKLTINKATPTVTAPTAKTNLVYDRSAQALVNAGSTTGGELQYKLDNGSYGTTVPTATAAGTYTVYYKVVGGSNYNDVAEASVSVTIDDARFTVTLNNRSTTLQNPSKITAGSASVTAILDSAMPTATMPSHEGYTFGGYYDGENGTGTQYYNADGTSARTWDKTDNATLYAKWTVNQYDVRWYNGSTLLKTDTLNYNAQPSYSGADPTKASDSYNTYAFKGWATEDGALQKLSSIPRLGAANVDYYAWYSSAPRYFNVTVASTTNGTVTADVTQQLYEEDVELTVTPSNGYIIDTMSVKQGGTDVALRGSGSDYAFTMPAGDVTVTVTFIKISTVNIRTPANGTLAVEVDGSAISNGTKVIVGKTVSLTNDPAMGYHFASYTVKQGATTVTVTNGSFTMPAGDVTISATFEKTDYAVTVNATANGTVTASKSIANYMDSIVLTIAPSEGYRLVANSLTAVGGNNNPVTISGAGSARSFTMPASDVTVSAEFEMIPPTLKWEVELPNTPATGYYESSTITADVYATGAALISFEFTPLTPTGLTLSSVVSDAGTLTANNGVYSWSKASGGDFDAVNRTKLATLTYTVTADTPTAQYTIGIANTPSAQWHGDKTWTLANESDGTYAGSADVRNVQVTLAAGQNGSITQADTFYAKYNSTKLYTDIDRTNELANWATAYAPDTGYQFANWNDGAGIWNTATAFTANKSLTAIFALGVFDIETSVDNATVTYTGGVENDTVTYLTAVTFTVEPDASYAIKGVTYKVGTGTAKPLTANGGVYTIPGNALTAAVTVTVTTQKYYTIEFLSGNTELGDATFYVVAGAGGLYTDTVCESAAPTVETPDPSDGYRLDTDNSDALKWAIDYTDSELQDVEKLTSELGEYVFEGDATVTPKTVKTWIVTFTLTDGGHGGAMLSGARQVIDNGALLTLPTFAAFDEGYGVRGYNADGSDEVSMDALDVRGTRVVEDVDYYAVVSRSGYFISSNGDEGLTISTPSEAIHGEDLVFTVTVENGGTLQSVTYAIGEDDAVDFKTVDGAPDYTTGEDEYTFTIPGEEVVSYVTIAATMHDSISVTVTAAKGGTVNGGSVASKRYLIGESTGEQDFRLVPAEGRTVIAPRGVTVDEDGYMGVISNLEDDMNIRFTFGYRTYTVTGAVGADSDEATYMTDFTWVPSAESGIVAEVVATLDGEKLELTANEEDGSYTIAGADILGDIEVTYTIIESQWEFITKKQYGGLEKGTKIAILKADASEDGAYTLDGYGDMYVYNGSIGPYSNGTTGFMQIVDENEDETSLSVKLRISAEGRNETLTNSSGEESGVVRGALTGGDSVTLDDIGVLSAILSGKKSSKITVKQRLSADVNGDGVVNLRDVMWLMEEMAGLPHS